MKIYYNQNGLICKGDYYPIFINGEFGINYQYNLEKNGKCIAEFNLSRTYNKNLNLEEFVEYVSKSGLESKDAINQYFYESGKENTVLYDNDAKQMFDDLVNKFDVINKLLNKGN